MKNQTLRSHWPIALLAMALSLQAPQVRAEIVTTDDLAAQSETAAERAKVEGFLERANVKERLQTMGVDGLAAKDRVAAMSQEEIHALAQRIDNLPAGGALSTNDLIIILLLIILVAIIV